MHWDLCAVRGSAADDERPPREGEREVREVEAHRLDVCLLEQRRPRRRDAILGQTKVDGARAALGAVRVDQAEVDRLDDEVGGVVGLGPRAGPAAAAPVDQGAHVVPHRREPQRAAPPLHLHLLPAVLFPRSVLEDAAANRPEVGVAAPSLRTAHARALRENQEEGRPGIDHGAKSLAVHAVLGAERRAALQERQPHRVGLLARQRGQPGRADIGCNRPADGRERPQQRRAREERGTHYTHGCRRRRAPWV